MAETGPVLRDWGREAMEHTSSRTAMTVAAGKMTTCTITIVQCCEHRRKHFAYMHFPCMHYAPLLTLLLLLLLLPLCQ
jgi:hypothetical protein